MPRPGNGRRTMNPPPSRCLCAVRSFSISRMPVVVSMVSFDARGRVEVPVGVGLGKPDAEHAAATGEIADGDLAKVRFDRLARDAQAQPESGAVLAALHGRREEILDLAGRQT